MIYELTDREKQLISVAVMIEYVNSGLFEYLDIYNKLNKATNDR